MFMRHLGFLLLVWFPAQSAAQSCAAPTLERGYFVPDPKTTNHNYTKLTYACAEGFKPAVEGWWATITCQNGEWSHEPQCIDEQACFPPTIPNAEYTQSANGWYDNGHIIRVTCDDGYTHTDNKATARCTNGNWSSVPICERSDDACSAPPKIPHAVIIQEYQRVFATDSSVTYECEDGYAVEGGDHQRSVFCIGGSWTQPPTCGPSTGSSDPQFTAAESEAVALTWGRPGPKFSRCGNPPIVPNGNVVQTRDMFLKYECGSFYKLLGPETVRCHRDGTWSEVPTCKATFCTVDTNQHPDLKPVGLKYIKDGEKQELECEDVWTWKNYVVVECTDGAPTISECCNRAQIRLGTC